MDMDLDVMYREIKKKLVLLRNRQPYPAEISRYISEMTHLDWIYGSMRLDDSTITREGVAKIAGGEFIINATLDDHTSVTNYLETMSLVNDMAGMEIDLDEKSVLRLYAALEPGEPAEYRKNNPVLYAMSYNPPHFRDIPEQMKILFRWLHADETITNPMMKAVLLHHRLIEIYPFSFRTEALARMALYYQLVRSGYPPFSLNISEPEYYAMLQGYFKTDNADDFYEVVERGIYSKVEVMMRLTENND